METWVKAAVDRNEILQMLSTLIERMLKGANAICCTLQAKSPHVFLGIEVAYCAVGIEVHKGTGRKIGKHDFIIKEIGSRIKRLEEYKRKLKNCIALSPDELYSPIP